MSSDFERSHYDDRFACQVTLRIGLWLLILCMCAGAFMACTSETPDSRLSQGDASLRLRPITTALPENAVRRTVYVPVYSSIYLGLDIRKTMVDLASTVSVRNVSSRHAIVLESARYYDSTGKHIRDYITTPSEVPALATIEFVVREADTAGGPGANFLIRWAGPADVDEPLMEAVMVGRSGNAGISFASPGRTIKNDPAQ